MDSISTDSQTHLDHIYRQDDVHYNTESSWMSAASIGDFASCKQSRETAQQPEYLLKYISHCHKINADSWWHVKRWSLFCVNDQRDEHYLTFYMTTYQINKLNISLISVVNYYSPPLPVPAPLRTTKFSVRTNAALSLFISDCLRQLSSQVLIYLYFILHHCTLMTVLWFKYVGHKEEKMLFFFYPQKKKHYN